MNTKFTTGQLDTLRASYARLMTVHPDRLADFHRLFDGCTNAGLRQLVDARIKFVSVLALNALNHRLCFGTETTLKD